MFADNVLESSIPVISLSMCARGYYAGVQNLRMCRHHFRAAGEKESSWRLKFHFAELLAADISDGMRRFSSSEILQSSFYSPCFEHFYKIRLETHIKQ